LKNNPSFRTDFRWIGFIIELKKEGFFKKPKSVDRGDSIRNDAGIKITVLHMA
jgi:hypothetical protein